MEWTDEGIVLSARKHGESAAIVNLLTGEHGRHAGLVRGGAGKRARGIYEPGNRVRATWKARLEEHLGTYTCELLRAGAADWLDDPMRLAGLSAVCAVAEAALPEREPHPETYARLSAFIAGLGRGDWLKSYVMWERDLLADMGFGLDLSECAGGGGKTDLAYVSPKSGRAVSLAAGATYKDKLLRLPVSLLDDPARGVAGGVESENPADGIDEIADIADGLKLTGYFLERHAFIHDARGVPPARTRLAARISRS